MHNEAQDKEDGQPKEQALTQRIAQLEQKLVRLEDACREQGEDLRRRDSILDAISNVAENFLRSDDIETSINTMLAYLGKATEVSRVYIFANHQDDHGTLCMSQKYEWCTPGVTPQIDNPELQNLSYQEFFERWVEMLSRGKAIYGNVSSFPQAERDILEPQDILFLVVVPIFCGDDWWGFIGFDECERERYWSELDIRALNAVATMMGNAMHRRQTSVERIALQQQVIDSQQAAIRELSTPLIPLAHNVVLMPLIGSIDSSRAQLVMETLLEGVAHYQADTVILDITGVSVVDTQVANAFIQAAQAVRLLGARVILTGIGPAMAQTLVHLGVDLSTLETRGSLQSAVVEALHQEQRNVYSNSP